MTVPESTTCALLSGMAGRSISPAVSTVYILGRMERSSLAAGSESKNAV